MSEGTVDPGGTPPRTDVAAPPDPARRDEAIAREAYDRVPYPASAQYHTHPDLLAVIGILHGMDPVPADRCRVLELGCSDGGNLLPMAYRLPESTFLGIDISPLQIQAGERRVADLGLSNLELRASSLMDFDAAEGPFDYVIAHGVFSWVSQGVQEKILRICKDNLSTNGIAFVSYNTLPGWHLRNMVRDAMLFHTRDVGEPLDRAEKAVELTAFLADTVAGRDDPHSLFLDWAKEHLAAYRDQPSYLVHEYLEETNTPIYFHQFMARAGAAGLQYLGDADRTQMELDRLMPDVADRLRSFTDDRIALEQYVDFLQNRTFRRTLLCHEDVALDRTITPERWSKLYCAGPAKPVSDDPDLSPDISEEFRTPRDTTFSSSHPMAKAILVCLSEVWPAVMRFPALLEACRDRLGRAPETRSTSEDEETLADILSSFYFSGVVESGTLDPGCVSTIGDAPEVCPLVRHEAANGELVVTPLHHMVKMDDELARVLLTQLDGTRSLEEVARFLAAEVEAGRLQFTNDDQPLDDSAPLPLMIRSLLDTQLSKMKEHALLVG